MRRDELDPMTKPIVSKFLACVLAVMLPVATMSAETHAAMLYTSNTVQLNGIASDHASAVFSGDRIETPATGTVTLTAAGSTVTVGPSSSVVYEGAAMRLRSGATIISTESGMKLSVDKLLISPAVARSQARYGVVRSDGQVMIAALHGDVLVADGSDTRLVANGDTATISDPADKDDKGKGAKPAATTGSVHVSGKRLSTATLLAILLGTGAAAGIIAYETTKSPVTPTH